MAWLLVVVVLVVAAWPGACQLVCTEAVKDAVPSSPPPTEKDDSSVPCWPLPAAVGVLARAVRARAHRPAMRRGRCRRLSMCLLRVSAIPRPSTWHRPV